MTHGLLSVSHLLHLCSCRAWEEGRKRVSSCPLCRNSPQTESDEPFGSKKIRSFHKCLTAPESAFVTEAWESIGGQGEKDGLFFCFVHLNCCVVCNCHWHYRGAVQRAGGRKSTVLCHYLPLDDLKAPRHHQLFTLAHSYKPSTATLEQILFFPIGRPFLSANPIGKFAPLAPQCPLFLYNSIKWK